MMWILSHVRVKSKKRADQLEGDAMENSMEWHAPDRPSDFFPLSTLKIIYRWFSVKSTILYLDDKSVDFTILIYHG
jgi:hypothetical protein